MKKLLMIPYTFTVLNWASIAGLYHYLTKKDRVQDVWLQYQTSGGAKGRPFS